MRDRTMFNLESDVLRRGLREDVFDSRLKQFNSANMEALRYLESTRASDPQNPHTFDLDTHPKSRRYHESVFPAITDPNVTAYWGVELARITVPKGEVGFLVGLEQVLNDAEGNYYPSNVAYWGSPTFGLDDVDNCRWYLKLDYFDGIVPDRFNLTAVAMDSMALPGAPYAELPEIDALWYPAHNGSRKLRLIIPGGMMLRFYFLTPPITVYQWQVRGKLRAYTQSTFSREAQANARMLF